MSSKKSKLRLTIAFAALATLALAVSCRGFFVSPTLTSIAIGPTTLPLSTNQSYQMIATGTFNDGSTSNVTGKCIWTSSDTSVASIGTNTGIVQASATATTVGTSQISATDGAVSSTSQATVTVCPAVTSLVATANPTSQTPTQTITFSATADVAGQNGVDVTSIATWNVGDSSILTISGNIGTISGTATVGQTTTVSATVCTATSPVITITVN
jgi:hypothetical protein